MNGKEAKEIWDNPKRAAQKDTDARWTIKYSKKKEGAPKGQVDIAIPSYGYKSHIMTDRAHGFIRSFTVTDASRHDGAQLPGLLRRDIMATGVWADSAYRSKKNEAWLARRGFVSHIHRKKPPGKPMPDHIRRGNATRSKVRAFVEHVFADQKHRMGMKIRTIGLDRAKIKIGLCNIAYNEADEKMGMGPLFSAECGGWSCRNEERWLERGRRGDLKTPRRLQTPPGERRS